MRRRSWCVLLALLDTLNYNLRVPFVATWTAKPRLLKPLSHALLFCTLPLAYSVFIFSGLATDIRVTLCDLFQIGLPSTNFSLSPQILLLLWRWLAPQHLQRAPM
jgi:hypothetical protein